MASSSAETLTETDEPDYVEAVLAYHGGDVHAAITTLVEDCRHLRQQLAVTEFAMSRGMTRGWTPKLDRD